MSTTFRRQLPNTDGPTRAEAKVTVWRLAAAALGHPVPELRDALADGSFHAAFGEAWETVTGRAWPRPAAPAPFADFEAGYIATFQHGPGGQPVAPLLGSAYEELLGDQSRPAYMLNVAAFYRHFGLQPATGDEGQTDEPDHLAAELEFMAVLGHLEAGALRDGGDADSPRRAQRDFLRRYLAPLLAAVAARLRGAPDSLDPTLHQLIDALAEWSEVEAGALEAHVGTAADGSAEESRGARPIDQHLWE